MFWAFPGCLIGSRRAYRARANGLTRPSERLIEPRRRCSRSRWKTYGGPAQPSPTGFFFCKTHQPAAHRHSTSSGCADLKCRSGARMPFVRKKGRYAPPVPVIKPTMELEFGVCSGGRRMRMIGTKSDDLTADHICSVKAFDPSAHSVTSRIQIRWPSAGTQRHQFWRVIAIRPDARCSGSIGSSNPADVYPKGLQWGMGEVSASIRHQRCLTVDSFPAK